MRALLRLPDFRLLFIGLVASMVGDSLMLLVSAIWVKELTGSSGAAGLVTLFLAVPYVVAPFGGWVIDRFRRRRFLIAVNLASSAMLLPLLRVRGPRDVWLIYAVMTLYGLSLAVGSAALNGLMKELLAEELLARANGMLQTIKEGLRLGGPLAGAALFAALGGAAVATFDAVSFMVAALAIAAMRLREGPPERTGERGLAEMTAGMRHIAGDAPLRRAVTAGVIAMLVIGFTESALFAVVDQGLHRTPAFVGVLSSAQGAGAIAGGLVAARLVGRFGELAATAIGLVAFGAGVGLCALTNLPAVLAGICVGGWGLPIVIVGITTVLQRRTPAPLVGRASIAADALFSGPQTVSIATGSLLVSLVDYRLLLATVFAGTLAAAIYLWLGRGLMSPQPVDPEELLHLG
jgi:MFS family permease